MYAITNEGILFLFYCSESKVSNMQGVVSNLLHTTSSTQNQIRSIPKKVQSEQVQVVPQQTLQPNQWGSNSVPFYRKPNFQQRSRVTAQAQKSFQKFVPPGNTVGRIVVERNSIQSSSDNIQIGLEIQQVWQQARLKQIERIEAKKVHIKYLRKKYDMADYLYFKNGNTQQCNIFRCNKYNFSSSCVRNFNSICQTQLKL